MVSGGLQEEFVLWLQSQGEWLVRPMEVISGLGNGPLYIFSAAVLYWCFDRRCGARLFLILVLSAGVNAVLKPVIRAPRPYWLNGNIQGFEDQASFGMPSGHSQSAVSAAGAVAVSVRGKWVYIAGVVFALLMGFSRIVLGVHYIGQVLVGFCVGLLVVWGVVRSEEPVLKWLDNRSNRVRIGAVVVFSFLIVGAGMVSEVLFSDFRFSSVWMENAPHTFAAVEGRVGIAAFDSLRGVVKAGGALCGFGLGLIAAGAGQVGGVEGSWLQKFLRVLVGSVVLASMWYVSEIYRPEGGVFLNFYRFVGTALAGFWISGLAPLVFHRVGLSGTALERMESP